MTEQEWLACETPAPLVEFLRKLGTDSRLVSPLAGKGMLRKVQLFLCGCCRRRWDTLIDERSRRAVDVAERHADGLAKKAELQKARKGAEDATCEKIWDGLPSADDLTAYATKMSGEQASNGLWRAAHQAPIGLLRCVFGNPFRPAAIAPEWLTPTVESLGQAAYDERDLPSGEIDVRRLAVLSDALEEVGCTDVDLLDHLRVPGPHVRGCWALDLILGKQ